MSDQWIFHANGKLLITGEYLVLEGARGLALPLTKGQHMQVNTLAGKILRWEAFSPGGLWFEATFSLPDLNIISTSDLALAEKLHEILSEVFCDFLFQKNRDFILLQGWTLIRYMVLAQVPHWCHYWRNGLVWMHLSCTTNYLAGLVMTLRVPPLPARLFIPSRTNTH